MRLRLIAPLLLSLLLACQMGAPGGGLEDDAIAVTALDAPVGAVVEPAAVVEPEIAAVPEVAVPEVAAEPEAPKTAEQMLCEKAKGSWVAAGESGAFYCASMTRDGGKQCSTKTQCQGVCLARSHSCSPVTPLYGCNDVLEKDGRQVTLCID